VIAFLLIIGAAYLIGSIPFGVVVAKLRGVDLRTVGSGNIGATNAGRVLGRPFAVLVFALDFAKGAMPTALVVRFADRLPEGGSGFGPVEVLHVATAAAAFLGHMFPIYLKFRGGKGVAIGAGVAAALALLPFAAAVVAWSLTALLTRYVSAASLAAAAALAIVRLIEPTAIEPGRVIVTAFIVLGAMLVFVKHYANIGRLICGTESRIGDGPKRHRLIDALHLLALSLVFGGAFFFNFVAAPAIFRSFKELVGTGPSDRTAQLAIVPADADDETKNALASALAGAAVGPIFPLYFRMLIGGLFVALATAFARTIEYRKLQLSLLGIAFMLAVAGWFVSQEVSRLRSERYSHDETLKAQAKADFGPVHLVSLAMSAVGTLLAGAALAVAGRSENRPSLTLPDRQVE